MSFFDTLSKEFPDVEWTGSSDIHVSWAVQTNLPISFDNKSKLLKLFDHVKMGEKIFRMLLGKFPQAEFLLGTDEFHKLFMADAARFLSGLGSLETPNKLKNPVTGNKFHRIALLKDFVGGFRFWLEPQYSGINFGFRFRWEGLLDNEEENVREDARERVRLAEEEYVTVEKTIMDIAEPPKEAVAAFEAELEKL